MNLIVYRKSGCPWSAAVIGFLNELDITFSVRNVTSHPEFATELKAKSGQFKSPTLDLDGQLLVDASVEEVAKLLETHGIVL